MHYPSMVSYVVGEHAVQKRLLQAVQLGPQAEEIPNRSTKIRIITIINIVVRASPISHQFPVKHRLANAFTLLV